MSARLVAAGLVGVVAGVVLAPAIARSARPALRSAVRGGVRAWVEARALAAEVSEAAEDAWAETMHELREAESAVAEDATADGEGDPAAPELRSLG